MTRLAAIVPATDAPLTLERCLAAILDADEAPDELVVVDAADLPGPAAARNEGARRSRADVLVFVDADVEPHADAFARIRRAFEADPALDAIFGSYDDDPADPGLVSRFRNLLHHHVHHESPGPATTFWAGLGAVRREAFFAVGGFDAERYPAASIEDVELGLRLTRIELDPRIQGTHLKAWTLPEMVWADFARRGVPWAELLLERGQGSTALNLGPRHRASALAALGVAGGLPARGRRLAGVSLVALLALNARFYALLLRREGPVRAAAGVGLHMVHHLTGVAAAATALARRGTSGRGRGATRRR
jgi:glycosyltransferase involved in cell wall biosynthesis